MSELWLLVLPATVVANIAIDVWHRRALRKIVDRHAEIDGRFALGVEKTLALTERLERLAAEVRR